VLTHYLIRINQTEPIGDLCGCGFSWGQKSCGTLP